MTNEEYGKIIARNLKRIAYDHHKTQIEIAKDLGLKQSTVSSWMNGTRIPRMPKIDLLCNYFNCSREEIMEDEAIAESFISGHFLGFCPRFYPRHPPGLPVPSGFCKKIKGDA